MFMDNFVNLTGFVSGTQTTLTAGLYEALPSGALHVARGEDSFLAFGVGDVAGDAGVPSVLAVDIYGIHPVLVDDRTIYAVSLLNSPSFTWNASSHASIAAGVFRAKAMIPSAIASVGGGSVAGTSTMNNTLGPQTANGSISSAVGAFGFVALNAGASHWLAARVRTFTAGDGVMTSAAMFLGLMRRDSIPA